VGPYRGGMRLLFVCSGNLCRSPVAERLTRRWADEALGESAGTISVASAGLIAPPDQPMHPYSAAALMGLGSDPGDFRSRRFEPDMADEADLVLTMTRRQRRSVLERTPRGLRRTFTLLEAAELLSCTDLGDLAAVSLEERVQALLPRLDAARAERSAAATDDIPDPVDQPLAVHETVADIVARALRPLTGVLFTGRRAGQADRAA
jgi:protein-tyrosine phosphatase